MLNFDNKTTKTVFAGLIIGFLASVSRNISKNKSVSLEESRGKSKTVALACPEGTRPEIIDVEIEEDGVKVIWICVSSEDIKKQPEKRTTYYDYR